MFRPLTASVRKPAPRRGALLIAVLGLLTLFAIFALFFVFYADNEANGARIFREGESDGDSGPPNDFALAAYNSAMRTIVFDEYDSASGAMNSLRGHSLARSMYSWNGTAVGPSASAPFSGIGTFHETAPNGMDRAAWIHYAAPYTVPATMATAQFPANTYYLDPEWTGWRTAGEVSANTLPGATTRIPTFPPQVHVPKNAPYTYPDLKDLILASLSPATGEVLVPSLHRNWLFNSGNANQHLRLAPWYPADTAAASNTAANTDWITPEGRTRILRPRPVDQLIPADFSNPATSDPFDAIPTGPSAQYPFALPFTPAALPYPILPGHSNYNANLLNGLYNRIMQRIQQGRIIPYPPFNADGGYTGDLQNLMGSVGIQRNDSILVDIGLPPRKWNNRWIKPLVSILLSDLDGLLNLNAHGNMRGGSVAAPGFSAGYHQSHNGFGPHEVNLGRVLSPGEAANVVQSRYARTSWTTSTNFFPGSRVMNAGNFYLCIGPMGGGISSAIGPGPTQSYNAMTPFNDNGLLWVDDTANLVRNGTNTLTLDRNGRPVPLYSPVNFDSGGNAPTYTAPSFPNYGFHTAPLIVSNGTPPQPQSFFSYGPTADTYNKSLNHPGLLNTHDWPAGTALRRFFGLGDTKRFNIRYAADRDYYLQSEVARSGLGGTSLIGTTGNGPSYRLDAAHYNRGLITTFGSFLDRPHLVSNFNTNVAGFLSLTPGQLSPNNVAFTGNFAAGAGADFVGAQDLRNPRAMIGGVDLNRPLTDYRADTTTPLHPNNAANAAQAWTDRQNLAREIFARLIVSTGALAHVDTPTGNVTLPQPNPMGGYVLTVGMSTTPVSADQYNALRSLAQLAANAVDLIDNDDVSTAFVWNPVNAMGAVTLQQFDLATFTTAIAATSMTDLANRAVFGVEKPRLVINEAYSEAVNDPNEPNGKGKGKGLMAMNDGGIRFWVELLNPTSTAYPGGNGPIGSGSVQLRYDAALDGVALNPYRLEIARAERGGVTGYQFLSQPRNVVGQLGDANGTTYDPDVRYHFDAAGGANRIVGPNNGVHNPGNAPLTSGIALVGPEIATGNVIAAGHEFDPKTTNAGGRWNNMIEATFVAAKGMGIATGMEYRLPSADLNMLNPRNTTSDFRRHIILLRRLANPYLAPSATNPYITVDFMDYVYTNDAVFTGMGGMTGGGEAIADRFSTGKVQPYAGYSIPDPNGGMASLPTHTFQRTGAAGGSFVLIQSPNPANATEPQHTFGRHNGRTPVGPNPGAGAANYTNGPAANLPGETLMAPFDWFVHHDRPLVNQLDLLSLQANKPHEVTQYSIWNNNGTLTRTRGLAPWLGVDPATGIPGFDTTNNRTNNGLYRAMESLRTKPWMHGMPFGGKQHGRININMIQDQRILQALLDPSTANSFNAADVTMLWNGQAGMTPIPGLITNAPGAPVVGSRTVNSQNRPIANSGTVHVPVPGPTYDDVPNGIGQTLDRPIRSFGAGEFTQDGSSAALAARFGAGLQDTLLRVNTVPGSPTFGSPLVSLASQTQPYMQAEMLRKMFNNTTTVSHAFAASITVVFHEVRMNGASMVTLNDGIGTRYAIGKEAYKDIPGDLRQQFFAVIDRSSIGVIPSTTTLQTNPFAGQFESITPVTSISTPPVPPYIAHPGILIPTYNLYLANTDRLPGTLQPYPQNGFPYHTTIYMDGRPVRIGNGGYTGNIVVGTGTQQEVMSINYVNEDGSINVNRTNTNIVHSPGEVVASFVTGNPGPVNAGNPSNPGPFDPLNQNANNPYRAVVPYAQRVR